MSTAETTDQASGDTTRPLYEVRDEALRALYLAAIRASENADDLFVGPGLTAIAACITAVSAT